MCLQGLFAQLEPEFLLFYLLLLIGGMLFLQVVAQVLDGPLQFGIGEHEDGVALVQTLSFFSHDAHHAARFTGVHSQGTDGFHVPFHVNIFQEGGLFRFSRFDVILVDAHSARSKGQCQGVNDEPDRDDGAHQVIFVT